MTRYEDQVAVALEAVALRPPDAFLWFGRRETVSADGLRAALVAAIARRLHEDFFAGATPRPRSTDAVAAPQEPGAFGAALSQANGGRGAWQAGWRIDAGDDDGLHVTRPDGLTLVASSEEVRGEGAAATVLLPKELRGLSPGFFVALGDSGTPSGDEPRTGLYWNVAAAGAATLVARITYALNGAGVPFSLELPDSPARYGRGDSALLLLACDDCGAAIALLRPLLRTLGAHLGEAAPAFTQPLGRGLAMAEQPPGTTRFGEQCCGLLAEAVVAAGEDGDRLGHVREGFAAAGLSLDAPYRQPGSAGHHPRS